MIRLVDICKAYEGRPVLSHVDAFLPDGGVLRIAGPNGVGKSTLLKIVLGLVTPDSGRVEGRPDNVAAVFQEHRLCPWLSAVGNIRLVVPSLTRPNAERVLRDYGLPDDALTRPVRELSGGQRRRVSIARAVVTDAALVCLDEPFNGIDADSLDDVIGRLTQHLKGRDVLLVTHDDAEAAAFGGATLTLSDPNAD